MNVYGSPFRNELNTPCELRSSKLGGIQYLNQSSEIYRTPVSKSDALIQLL